MKQFLLALILGSLAAVLTGCTYSDPPVEAGITPTVSTVPSASAPSTTPETLEGKFQSQGAVTSGGVTIRVTDTGAVLQLEDFSTEPGEDLRLMLGPGTLSTDATGSLGLTSTTLIDLGPVSGAASQRVDMDTKMWSAMPSSVRSVVIYNYSERTAYGTANLTDIQELVKH